MMSVLSFSGHLPSTACAKPWTLIKAGTGQALGAYSLVGFHRPAASDLFAWSSLLTVPGWVTEIPSARLSRLRFPDLLLALTTRPWKLLAGPERERSVRGGCVRPVWRAGEGTQTRQLRARAYVSDACILRCLYQIHLPFCPSVQPGPGHPELHQICDGGKSLFPLPSGPGWGAEAGSARGQRQASV